MLQNVAYIRMGTPAPRFASAKRLARQGGRADERAAAPRRSACRRNTGARRKFHELWANHASKVGQQALRYFQVLFRIEDIAAATAEERRRVRQRKSRRVAAALHKWLLAQRQLVPDGSATAKAIDYSLKRWKALTRYIDDGDVPISNNWVENQIRPIALGRSNWLFAGSLRAGQRAAAVMSLVHSAKINGHDPYAYLKDVLERLPTQPASRIEELLPHRWTPLAAAH